jgi:hypothetical protein
MNFEIPPPNHLTRKLILNPVEGRRAAGIPNQLQSAMG